MNCISLGVVIIMIYISHDNTMSCKDSIITWHDSRHVTSHEHNSQVLKYVYPTSLSALASELCCAVPNSEMANTNLLLEQPSISLQSVVAKMVLKTPTCNWPHASPSLGSGMVFSVIQLYIKL